MQTPGFSLAVCQRVHREAEGLAAVMVSSPAWLPLGQGMNCTVKMQGEWGEEKQRCLEWPPDQEAWPWSS